MKAAVRLRRSLIAVVPVLLVIGACVYFTRRPQRIAHHLARMNALKAESKKISRGTDARRSPSTFRDYTHLSTLMWCLKGKPSLADDWLKEQQALVDLGYFEQRELVLTNRQAPFDPSKAQLDPEVRKAFFGGLNASWFVQMDHSRPYWIKVVGTNLDAFEKILRRWDVQPGMSRATAE